MSYIGMKAVAQSSYIALWVQHRVPADFNPIDLTSLLKTPLTYQIKDFETANRLYLISIGEHTGKLAHHVQVIKSSLPDKRATWWLQITKCQWSGPGLTHSKVIVDVPLVQTMPDTFVVVHEINATKKKANEIMCAIREQNLGCMNGYSLVNGTAVKAVKCKI